MYEGKAKWGYAIIKSKLSDQNDVIFKELL